MDPDRIVKYLSEAIPQGEHPRPHAEWVPIRLDVAQEAIDYLDWLEKGNAEWRRTALTNSAHAEAARATARIAIDHLDAVLNKAQGSWERQQAADAAARTWMASIGYESK